MTFTFSPRPVDRSTAQVLERARRTGELDQLAAVGMALHHLTTPVRLDPVTAHRATTVLTKQIQALIDLGDPAAVADLVVDPGRPALADATTAAELPGWAAAQPVIHERADAMREGVMRYGGATLCRLAAVSAAARPEPWWSTAAWDDAIAAWARGRTVSEVEFVTLRERPESVRAQTLEGILQEHRDGRPIARPRG